MNENIKDVVPGDAILAATFNQGNPTLRSVRTITGSGGISVMQTEEAGTSISFAERRQTLDTFLVKIVAKGPNGESDFTDARYWGQIEYLKASNPNDAITLGDDVPPVVQPPDGSDAGPQYPAIIVCTNQAEMYASDLTGSHGLPTGGGVQVRVFGVYDRGDPRSKHYVFSAAIPHGLFRVALTQTGGSGTAGWTYTAKSLDGSITYGTALAPEDSHWGNTTAATKGDGYFDDSGNFNLAHASEGRGNQNCT